MNEVESELSLNRYGFWPFVLPFLVFMVMTMFEPTFPKGERDMLGQVDSGTAKSQQVDGSQKDSQTAQGQSPTNESDQSAGLSNDELGEFVKQRRAKMARSFFISYAAKIAITSALLIFFASLYVQHFPISFSWLAVLVGVAGVVIWIGLCNLGLETKILELFLGEAKSVRSQFNPFSQLESGWQQISFLGVRFLGLVLIVPICEELFLRGFLMRFVESPSWWNVQLARLSTRTLLVAPIYGVATHPTEALAAIVWFSLVTWLVQQTGKFWDAVLAHAITNMLLGLYVCTYSQWQLW